jgi:hypothetical protein
MPVGPASQDVTKGDSADNLRTVSPCPGYGLLAVRSTVTRLVVLQTLNLSDKAPQQARHVYSSAAKS